MVVFVLSILKVVLCTQGNMLHCHVPDFMYRRHKLYTLYGAVDF
jgi:hypothetical protein